MIAGESVSNSKDMNENLKIRLADTNEIDALVEFNQSMALETENKALDEKILRQGVAAVLNDQGKGFYVVAENETGIAGGLLVTFEWSDWRNAWFWWIQSVYIRPQFRGRGVYGLMYEFVKSSAAESGGICGFRLYVERDNARARRVYEKLGMNESHYVMYEEGQ